MKQIAETQRAGRGAWSAERPRRGACQTLRAPRSTPRAASRGSAILLVFWALIVLSAAILAWAKITQHSIRLANEAGRGLEARAMAHSGVAVALHPAVSKTTPLLEESVSADIGYRVRMVSEGGKLNLKLLLEGEDPTKVALVERWLESRGLGFPERRRFLDCYYDYVDPDNLHRLNGMEDEGDYHPPNRPIQSVDEIALIANSEPLTSTPGWKDDLTVESQGRIDLLAAEPDILRLIPGFGESRIQQLLLLRRGRDGVEGTIDDPKFDRGLPEVLQLLGLDPNRQEVSSLLIINDPNMRIISEGRSGKVVRQVEVVAVKGNNPTIKSWKE